MIRYIFFILVLPVNNFLAGCTANSASNTIRKPVTANNYKCLPCGLPCDTANYPGAGNCHHCNMVLVPGSTIIHKTINPGELCMLDEKSTLFLDVRTTAEFNGTAPEKFGAIKNAANIPVQELESRLSELDKYKEKDIVVYCSHSHRSPRASYMLTQSGFTKVINMSGGMSVWKEQVHDSGCNQKIYREQ